MKIVYITEKSFAEKTGVSKKIREQIKCWLELGHRGLVASFEDFCCYNFQGMKMLDLKKQIQKKNKLATFINLHFFFLQLARLFIKYKPDICYSRYFLFNLGLMKILKSYPTVWEINTKDDVEFFHNSYFTGYYNSIFRSFNLRNCAGLVAVTKELERHFLKFGKPIITIGNGIKVEEKFSLPLSRSGKPKIAFIGSDKRKWYGLEIIKNLANSLKDFDFHFCGIKGIDKGNFFYHGYMSEPELIKFLSEIDVGISSLGLASNNMKDACPLKSRLFLSLGIPIIMGYEDPDVMNNEEFVCRIYPGQPIAKQTNKIREFVYKVKTSNCLQSQAWNYAYRNLNVERKEFVRLSFFYRLLRKSRIGDY